VNGKPSEHTCDVIVVGGGPAGASAAIRLAESGFSVVLLERTRRTGARLGETLPPHSRLVLRRLGVWEAFSRGGHLASNGITSYWGARTARENDFLFNPHGCGWHLDREQFDACLLAEAERRGVRVLRRARVLSCVQEKERAVRVRLAADARTLSARFVIDATGRSGVVRRSLSRAGTHTIDRLVGLVAHSPDAGHLTNTRTLIEATERGWWYSAPVPDGGLVSVFLTDADFVIRTTAKTLWDAALRAAPATEARMKVRAAARAPLDGPRVVPASSFLAEELGGNCWAAVGDAAMTWDPLSSQGICKGMESGLALADAYEHFEGGDSEALRDFFIEARDSFSKYLALRASYYTQETRWPDSTFWRRRELILPDFRYSRGFESSHQC
jgi:flavin-dependent dehydrogenase